MSCVMTQGDFEMVNRRKHGKPQPTPVTLADFMPTKTQNSFDALNMDEKTSSKNNLHQVNADASPREGTPESCDGCDCSSFQASTRKKNKAMQRLRAMHEFNDDGGIPGEPNIPDIEPNTPVESLDIDLFEMETDDDEIINAEEEKEIEVAMDSGSVVHAVEPDDLPPSVEIKPPPPNSKNFVGAGGHGIKRHGKAEIILVQEDGTEVNVVSQVADVTRALHSTSQVCDSDKEVLFTKTDCFVVPDGALSRYLRGIKIFAKYGRRGGLWTAKMKVRDPRRRREPRPKQVFARPGATQ